MKNENIVLKITSLQNQQYNRPPFNRNFQKNHSRFTKNPLPPPQSQKIQPKDAPPQSQSTNCGTPSKDKSDAVICHKCNKENHFAKDCKENVVKDLAFYLRMDQELEEKEKGKAYVAQVKRNHQVWSSRDEDEDNHSKSKGKICMVVTADEDDSTKLKKNHCYMAKDGTHSIVEQVKLMI